MVTYNPDMDFVEQSRKGYEEPFVSRLRISHDKPVGLMVDHDIIAEHGVSRFIEPFIDHQVSAVDGEKVVSYGLSSVGYDIRIADEWKKPQGILLDVKRPHEGNWVSFVQREPVLLSAGEFILGRSVEYFRLPRDVMGVALAKSTYCRVGVFPNISPLEVSWEGYLTIEIANIGHCPVVIYPNEGIAQILFFRVDSVDVSYAERKGKYQGTDRVTLGRA